MMYLLYGLLILMLLGGICLLFIPFITQRISMRYFLLSTLFVILFSFSLYEINNHQTALKQWLTVGEAHYELQQEVDQLGGLTGIIERIKKKLAKNPDDFNGWLILGKLYLVNQQYQEAKESLEKAAKLHPNDREINRLYNLAVEKTKSH